MAGKKRGSVIINFDPNVSWAGDAQDTYRKTLEGKGITVIEIKGRDPEKVIVTAQATKDLIGLITIGHGYEDNSNWMTRAEIKRARPPDGFQLLVLQSCFSFDLINEDGFIDEAGDLMAEDGLLMVNFRYSSVVGFINFFNKGIGKWADGETVGREALNYRILIYYNFVVDLVYTPLGWLEGLGGKSEGEKGKKQRK